MLCGFFCAPLRTDFALSPLAAAAGLTRPRTYESNLVRLALDSDQFRSIAKCHGMPKADPWKAAAPSYHLGAYSILHFAGFCNEQQRVGDCCEGLEGIEIASKWNLTVTKTVPLR